MCNLRVSEFLKRKISHWQWSSIKGIIEMTSILAGAIIGTFAFFEYRTTNEIALLGQLQSIDREISNLQFNNPMLYALWIYPPDSLKGKDRADFYLKAIIDSSSVVSKKITGDTWKTVQDLESILWSNSNFYDTDLQKIRKVYDFTETILYLVTSAIDYAERGQIKPEDEKIFVAYIGDIGTHPLFLEAVWFGYRGGYFSEKAAIRMQKELLKNEEAKTVISIIYKELLDKNWPYNVGKSK